MNLEIYDSYWKKRYKHYFVREIIEHKILRDRLGIVANSSQLFCGEKLPNVEETNRIIYDAIASGKPFAMTRPGNGEVSFAAEWEEEQLFGRRIYKRRSDNWTNNLQLFGNRTDEYNMIFRRDIADSDIFSVFQDMISEEYLAERYVNKAQFVSMSNTAPIRAKRPWSEALAGKKVLVVSIFADFLEMQYEKRSKLYNGEWQFPDFELIPVKSIWYFSKQKNSQFQTWFDALNYLYDEIMKHDFDIAILSCGSFAIHLAPMIKRAGKQAIQYAGELQMLFGIRGQRWDDHPFFSKYYNDSWIRVTPEESGVTSNNSKGLDEGCYW
ncbi:hypothetical protein [Butyrivibrio sp. XBB1001]|uniref:hypothetical protein n=1 Tax=Butyrivibrio sp. XBB1001 TaxID=1280682 RepID=UPI000408C9A8|nr:hypothetical protein [Butyrivibrio sp. XBB1001]